MSVKAALLFGLLATAAAGRDCWDHTLDGKRTLLCTELTHGGTVVQLSLTCYYNGWVGFGFRPKDSQQGMAMTDFVVIEYEGSHETGLQPSVRDMYARTNGQPKDDGCASDWKIVWLNSFNNKISINLERAASIVDTNQDHAFVPGEMTFLLAHGGAKGDWKMANHGKARKQWATAAEPTAADPNFGDETKPAVCATPAPPTPCEFNPCGLVQDCVEELPTFVCVCKNNPTQRAKGKQVEFCSKTTTRTTWSEEGGDSDGLSGGAIAGIVVGVVVGLAVVGAAVWFFAFRSAGGGASAPAAAQTADKQLPSEPTEEMA